MGAQYWSKVVAQYDDDKSTAMEQTIVERKTELKL